MGTLCLFPNLACESKLVHSRGFGRFAQSCWRTDHSWSRNRSGWWNMRRTLYQKWASRSRLKSVRFKRNAEEIRKRFGRNPDETQMKFRRAPPKHELRFLYRKEFDSNERPLISGVLMHKISWSKKSGNHHVLISQLIEPDAIKHLAFLKLRRLQGARTVEWKFGSIFLALKSAEKLRKQITMKSEGEVRWKRLKSGGRPSELVHRKKSSDPLN